MKKIEYEMEMPNDNYERQVVIKIKQNVITFDEWLLRVKNLTDHNSSFHNGGEWVFDSPQEARWAFDKAETEQPTLKQWVSEWGKQQDLRI